MGIIAIVASGIVGALFSLGYKVNGLRPNASDQLLVVLSALSLLVTAAAMLIFHQWTMPAAAVVTGLPQGAASFVAVTLFLTVTRRSRLNVSWTIIQFYVVIPFFVSLLLFHDHFTVRGGGGVALILASILLFSKKRTGSAAPHASPADRRNILLLITSTVLSGVANSMPKVYTSVPGSHLPFPQIFMSNLSFLVIALCVFALRTSFAVRAARRSDLPPARRWTLSWLGFGVGTWMGFMQLVGSALLIVGLTLVPGTAAFPIRIVINIVAVVVLSRLIFREELTRAEVAGTLVAMVGVALVASSA